MAGERQFVSCASIRPACVVFYATEIDRQYSSRRTEAARLNLSKAGYSGQIKQAQRRKIRKGVEWLLATSELKTGYSKKEGKKFSFRINFVTLTLSSKQIHCDKTIKRECLDKFIQACKNTYKDLLYIWRAEPQKNGNIHFHIVTNKYLPYEWIRNVWNKMQNKLGYVDRFAALNGHSDPNSTDVHSIKNIQNIAAYIAKYCTKDNGYRVICGKVYGMSDRLSTGNSLVFTEDMREYKEVLRLAMAGGQEGIRLEHCTVFPYSWDSLFKKHDNYAGIAYREHLSTLKAGSRN